MDNTSGFEKLCTEKHKAIETELTRHSSWLGDHEKKIDSLEKSDAKNTTQIDNLVQSMGGLTKALWGLVLTIAGALLGFVIWYIQSI